ncbi:MAG: chlorite dismutase family protein, partial [Ktedonobacteraceae bacterium]
MLPLEELKSMMDDHIRIGIKYREVSINTTYSFGLDDQEFVVAFETDHLDDFLDLVEELRSSEASQYTLRDTPMFTCVAQPFSDILDAIGA